jgi:hypothetical protein
MKEQRKISIEAEESDGATGFGGGGGEGAGAAARVTVTMERSAMTVFIVEYKLKKGSAECCFFLKNEC